MKIYIAGPLTLGDTITNIKKAIETAEIMTKKGHTPFIPHLSSYWHFLFPHEYDFWIEQGLEWLKFCDGLFRIPGKSKGADIEVKEAERLGIPVYYHLDEVPINQEFIDMEKFKGVRVRRK